MCNIWNNLNQPPPNQLKTCQMLNHPKPSEGNQQHHCHLWCHWRRPTDTRPGCENYRLFRNPRWGENVSGAFPVVSSASSGFCPFLLPPRSCHLSVSAKTNVSVAFTSLANSDFLSNLALLPWSRPKLTSSFTLTHNSAVSIRMGKSYQSDFFFLPIQFREQQKNKRIQVLGSPKRTRK